VQIYSRLSLVQSIFAYYTDAEKCTRISVGDTSAHLAMEAHCCSSNHKSSETCRLHVSLGLRFVERWGLGWLVSVIRNKCCLRELYFREDPESGDVCPLGLLEGLAMQWRWQRKGVAGSGGGPVRVATVARPVECATSSPVRLPRDSDSPHSLTDSNPQYSPGISIEVESPLRSRGKRSALYAFSPEIR
jgi:hypothetical protein